MQKWCLSAEITWFPVFQLALQGGLSGRGKLLVDIEIKVPPQFKLLILKRNSYFKVNKSLTSTEWATPKCPEMSDFPK